MMNNHSPDGVNKLIAWGQEYTDAWAVLVNGALDIEHTLDCAYEIWRTEGHRDPAEVAKENFDLEKAP